MCSGGCLQISLSIVDLMGYMIPDYVKRIYPQKVILLQLEEL